jgi:hypothetical protein
MFRLLIVKQTKADPRDNSLMTDSKGDVWREIAGTVAFDASDAEFERLRDALTDFTQEHIRGF